jgi:protein-S-isoprenylcysteine O-methyltransferase Ste14
LFEGAPLFPFEKEHDMTIYVVVLILIPIIWIAFETGLVIKDNSRGKGKTTSDKGTRCFNFIAITMGIATAAILNRIPGFVFPGGKTPTMFFAGVAIISIGMALRYWAVATLGTSFRTTVETDRYQKVVSNGPYKLIRHPSYGGWLLICCGYGIAVQNWLSLLVAMLLPLAALLYRIRVEEAALVSAFGPEYIEYQKRTKRLVPWIW